MSPRGGAGRGQGRKKKPDNQPRVRKTVNVTITLYPAEVERLDTVCDALDLNRTEFVRRSLALTEAQLEAVRKLAGIGGGGDEFNK